MPRVATNSCYSKAVEIAGNMRDTCLDKAFVGRSSTEAVLAHAATMYELSAIADCTLL